MHPPVKNARDVLFLYKTSLIFSDKISLRSEEVGLYVLADKEKKERVAMLMAIDVPFVFKKGINNYFE